MRGSMIELQELLQHLTLPPLLLKSLIAADNNHLFSTHIKASNFPTVGINNTLRNRPFSRNSLYLGNSLFSKLENKLFLKNSSLVCIGIVQVHVELKNSLFLENKLFLKNRLFSRLLSRNVVEGIQQKCSVSWDTNFKFILKKVGHKF